MKKLLFLLLFLPVIAYAQPTGKIMSNRSSNATLPVDTINGNTKLNLLQTTGGVTLTFPNRTTFVTSGTTFYLSNIGSVSVMIAVTGSAHFSLAINQMAILNWVGTKWTIIYVGSGGVGSYVQIAGDSMTGNLDMKGNNITGITKLIGKTSGDNIWFTPSSGMQINSYSDLYINGFNSTNINGQSVKIQPDNSLDISGSNTSQFVRLNTSALSVLRTVNFPDKPGTFAYTSDISALTASNGLTRTLNDWQLGGTLGSNTTINGSGSRSLTLGAVGSKLTSLLSYTSTGVSMIAANAGSLTLNSTTSDISHAGTGNTSVGGIDARAYVTWNDGTHYSTVSSELNGVGFNTTNGGYTGFFKTSRLLTADRNWQLPDSNGTLALAESLTKYLPLSGGTMSGPIDMFGFDIVANQIKEPTGSITIIDVASTVINDQSGNISQDFTSRQLNNTAGNPMLDYSSSSSGIGIGNAGGSSFGFIRNTLVSGGSKQYELPPSSGTFALTSDITGLYLPLTLGANTTVAMGSRTLDFTKSGNIVFRPSNGTFYDATPVQSADMFNRLLYDNIGGPVFTWANASTAGIGITRVGNNTYVAYLKNSNLTADKTYQFPNANTTFVGDDATQTLTNKTISGASNTLTNIGNSSLSNSTISGISLGSNLSALTLGTYLTGTSYNGSAGVTVNVSTMTSTVGGAVPTPPNNTTTFLRGDGTFATPSSSGTVSTVSVTSTNGFAGTVANATTTPAITVSTTVTGLLKGNGTSMSAATAGTDYAVPATIAADATDADYTAVINSVKYLPSATLTANRSITIPTGSNGDFLEIYNNEAGFSWLLSGASVYLSDGTTIVTSLYANTNHLIRKVSGKWRILN